MVEHSTKHTVEKKQFIGIATFFAIIAAGIIMVGCENADSVDGVSWNKSKSEEAPAPDTDTNADGGVSAGDQVAYSSLNWTYGGVSLPGAVHSGVTISNLKISSKMLTFKYDTDISAWGASHSDASYALACAFVKDNSGKWVGGKFDWISSSRTSRDFGHLDNYNGWTLSNVPNPTEMAFVIVSPDGKKRSNVLAGTWTR